MKFTISFCLAAIACVAPVQSDVTKTQKKLEQVKKEVDQLVDKAAYKIEETMQQAMNKTKNIINEIKKTGSKIRVKICEDIAITLQKLDKNISDNIEKAHGLHVNLNRCRELSRSLRLKSSAIIFNANRCIKINFKIGSNYVDEIQKGKHVAMRELTEIHDHGIRCFENIGSFDIARASMCVSKVKSKAESVISVLTENIEKIQKQMMTLVFSLLNCTTESPIFTFHQKAQRANEEIKACVEETIGEKVATETIAIEDEAGNEDAKFDKANLP